MEVCQCGEHGDNKIWRIFCGICCKPKYVWKCCSTENQLSLPSCVTCGIANPYRAAAFALDPHYHHRFHHNHACEYPLPPNQFHCYQQPPPYHLPVGSYPHEAFLHLEPRFSMSPHFIGRRLPCTTFPETMTDPLESVSDAMSKHHAEVCQCEKNVDDEDWHNFCIVCSKPRRFSCSNLKCSTRNMATNACCCRCGAPNPYKTTPSSTVAIENVPIFVTNPHHNMAFHQHGTYDLYQGYNPYDAYHYHPFLHHPVPPPRYEGAAGESGYHNAVAFNDQDSSAATAPVGLPREQLHPEQVSSRSSDGPLEPEFVGGRVQPLLKTKKEKKEFMDHLEQGGTLADFFKNK